MSAIAAIAHLDGAPADCARLHAVTLSMTARGPDAQHVKTRAAGGLGHCLFRTLPEDASQPVEDATGSWLLALDGRIDNRSDLAGVVGLPTGEAAAMSDAALVLGAYLKAGDAIFERLLGDFAILAWHAAARRLVAARDLFGLRPLYFRLDGRTLLAASTLDALRQSAPATIDEAMAAEALCGGFASTSGTLFREIARLPPGHLLTANADGIRIRRFIGLTAVGTRSGSHDSLGEELDALLTQSVRCRLRSATPVGVMLSGGIDSASVLATARVVANGSPNPVAAFTISHHGDPHDESDVARAIVASVGGAHCIEPSSAAQFDYLADAAAHADLPIHPSGANGWNLRRRAAQAGSPVLLLGVGSDEWFGGHRWHQTDLLVSGRWRQLWQAWQIERGREDRFTTPQFVAQTLMPILPVAIKRIGRVLTGDGLPDWIRPDFAQRVGLVDRLRVRPAVVADTYARRGLLINELGGRSVHALEEEERLGAASGTENRYPFYDRRLVQFALSLPDDVAMPIDTPKRFLRERFRVRLPASSVDQPVGLDYGFLMCDALRSMGGRAFFDDLCTEAAGWVDGSRARAAAETMWRHYDAGDVRYCGLTMPLWALAAVECWLRAISHPPAPAH